MILNKDKNKINIDLGIVIGGEAGMGVSTTGDTIAKYFLRYGYWSFVYNEYPSIIKGGHYASYLHITSNESHSHTKNINIIIALNLETIKLHIDKLSDKALIIFDKSSCSKKDEVLNDPRIIDIPLSTIAKEVGKNELMRNTVAMGALLPLLGMNIDLLIDMVNKTFMKKGQEIIDANVNCLKSGFEYVRKQLVLDVKDPLYNLEQYDQEKRLLITGNDSVAMGAIKAGMKYYAAYPMTPATNILHLLAKLENKYNIVTKHTEDEIAAINSVIGASFAGVRAMCGTSGGGFSLMVEGLGLAAMTETPIVIVVAQRPGPATGLPTWTDQGDLHFVLNASQGEFPRVVVAPGDNNECFEETYRAFNIAERFQIPVIILTDKYLAESSITTNEFQTNQLKIDRGYLITQAAINRIDKYHRYENTLNGVSPRTIPGIINGEYLANSDEHDEYGFANEDSDNRIEQTDKKFRKMFDLAKYLPSPKVYGNPKAKLGIICWGSLKLQMLDVLTHLIKFGVEIKFLHLTYLSPFPSDEVKLFINSTQECIIIENNATAQLAHLIREKTAITVERLILKYDGRPFDTDEIVKELLNDKNI